ncbi:hypothetical protein POTOM_034595 [Populus tomentosa]|uniref:Uncharacterized protein n=1 Tax=Populus tomentosa TaxID=118781 RepID=A0A8X7ZDM1_POPTO|nr:hypothetical protein POTOM_034595 [Populus tomentosa]
MDLQAKSDFRIRTTQSCGIALALEAFCPEFHLGCKKGRADCICSKNRNWSWCTEEWPRYDKKILVRKADIEKAIIQLMVDEEEIRNRARKLKEMERKKTEEGGSYKSITFVQAQMESQPFQLHIAFFPFMATSFQLLIDMARSFARHRVKYNHNERLIIEVLKIRVAVGAQEWSRHEREILVKREEIEMAVIQLLVGEEAEELRNRAQALREMAMRTTEEEGSSCCNLKALLKELRAIKTTSY